ncbi:MAG: hypothetical protein NZ551_08820 [Microscillaceae bacterium]|nr:hypothetical protein [Microscillaceae bacterium]MDW8461302.1 hypothetical protein [Cytophagales bacterium]
MINFSLLEFDKNKKVITQNLIKNKDLENQPYIFALWNTACGSCIAEFPSI